MSKLSIVTINYNNATGLQKTVDSVFAQGFSDLEYIVIDGASTDGSTAIINAHADKISYWVSEKDKGVYHAMNKGIEKASGEYLLFLNSGDHFYTNHVLKEIGDELDGNDIIYGDIFLIETAAKSWIGVYPDQLSFQHFVEGSLPHPASFIKRSLFDQVGFYDESLQICADWQFFLDAICRFNVSYKHINKTISTFYLDGLSSIGDSAAIIEEEKQTILNKDYPSFMETYNELTHLKEFSKNKYINAFANMAKRVGILKIDLPK